MREAGLEIQVQISSLSSWTSSWVSYLLNIVNKHFFLLSLLSFVLRRKNCVRMAGELRRSFPHQRLLLINYTSELIRHSQSDQYVLLKSNKEATMNSLSP